MTFIESLADGFLDHLDLLLPARWGCQAARRREALKRLGPARGQVLRA